jgi:4-hydroxybenzoate polyprenyltransferase
MAQTHLPDAVPTNWVDRYAPAALVPWLKLGRFDRPTGIWLLMLPGWMGAALAAAGVGKFPDPVLLILILIGAALMRAAGCAYNDIVDRDIDAQVERTARRPIPAGQISVKQAWLFILGCSLGGLVILLSLNLWAVLLGVASLVLVAAYPFMKRITWWPQLFLGLAFSWGALLGWTSQAGSLSWPPVLLYVGSILWVIGYDTIYAHQDKEDDAIVGVRSTARLFGDNTKGWLAGLYGGTLICFAIAFASAQAPVVALAGLIAAGAHMARQVTVLDINDPDQCLRLFRSNNQVGWLIFLGLIGGAVWVALKPLV